MAKLSLERVSKQYEGGIDAVKDLSLQVEDGSLCVLREREDDGSAPGGGPGDCDGRNDPAGRDRCYRDAGPRARRGDDDEKFRALSGYDGAR